MSLFKQKVGVKRMQVDLNKCIILVEKVEGVLLGKVGSVGCIKRWQKV